MDLSKYHYLYNALAYFESQEKFPDGLYEAISLNNREGLENICWMLQLLSEQGELARRALGYDKEETFNADEWISSMHPRDIIAARGIIVMAVESGLATNENAETDLTLVELKKKNT